jgi:hypothetical protein
MLCGAFMVIPAYAGMYFKQTRYWKRRAKEKEMKRMVIFLCFAVITPMFVIEGQQRSDAEAYPTELEGGWLGEWNEEIMIVCFIKNKAYWYGSWAGDGEVCTFKYTGRTFAILDKSGYTNEEWIVLLDKSNDYFELYEGSYYEGSYDGVFRRIK